jgi:hypothetical protein
LALNTSIRGLARSAAMSEQWQQTIARRHVMARELIMCLIFLVKMLARFLAGPIID